MSSSSSSSSSSPPPLAGVRVLELGGLAPSPFAGLVLADFGASVVRIDRPGASGLHSDILGGGRKSMVLDLKQPRGREVLRRMAERADVLIEPFRPGVMERLGLGPEELLQANPRLIYARLTGWGQPPSAAAGDDQSLPLKPVAVPASPLPSSDTITDVSANTSAGTSNANAVDKGEELGRRWHVTAGHDSNYLAMSGALSLFGRQGERPLPPMNVLGDFAGGGFLCAFGVLAALLERTRSGRGQVVDAAIVDAGAYFSAWPAAQVALGMHSNTTEGRGTNLLDTGAPFYDVYKTKDGQYMSVGSIEPQFYGALLAGLAHGAGLDPASLPEQHDRDAWPEMRRLFTEAFLQRSRAEWERIFEGTDACVVPILSLTESGDHPFVAQRQLWLPMDEERGGQKLRAAPAPRLSRSAAAADCGAFPAMGASTDDVLGDYGFSDAERAELHRDGVVEGANGPPKARL